MKVILNEVAYEIKEGSRITRQSLVEFPQHIRMTGQQTREGRSLMSSWWIENFESGYGCEKVNLASERQKSSFWDSEANTSILGQVTNPAKVNTVIVHTTYPPRWIYEYGGTVWGLYASGGGGSIGATAYITQWEATFWSYHTQALFGYGTNQGIPAKNFVYIGGVPRTLITRKDEATLSVSDISLIPHPALTSTLHPKPGGTLPLKWSGMIATNNYAKWMPANEGWAAFGTDNSLYLFDIESNITLLKLGSGDVKNITPFTGQDGYEGLFLFYDNQVSCLEGIPATIAEIPYVDLSGDRDSDNARDITVFNSQLIFPVQDALLAYAPNGDITDIGMNLFSGMPEDKKGKVVCLASSVRKLFAGVFKEGKTQVYEYGGGGWHWVGKTASIGTIASLFLLTDNDTSRLWHGANEVGTLSYINYPFDNPLHKTGYEFHPTSYLTLPQFDGAMPNIKGVAFGLAIDGNFGSNYYIDAYYATDGSTIFGYLGRANQAGVNQLSFGTGAPHTRIQTQLKLTGHATKSPVLYSAVLDYLKFPNTRKVFSFAVDLAKSAGDLSSAKEVVLKLQEAANSMTLIPFQYGAYSTVNVKITEIPFQEEILEKPESIFESVAGGLVTVQAVELYATT